MPLKSNKWLPGSASGHNGTRRHHSGQHSSRYKDHLALCDGDGIGPPPPPVDEKIATILNRQLESRLSLPLPADDAAKDCHSRECQGDSSYNARKLNGFGQKTESMNQYIIRTELVLTQKPKAQSPKSIERTSNHSRFSQILFIFTLSIVSTTKLSQQFQLYSQGTLKPASSNTNANTNIDMSTNANYNSINKQQQQPSSSTGRFPLGPAPFGLAPSARYSYPPLTGARLSLGGYGAASSLPVSTLGPLTSSKSRVLNGQQIVQVAEDDTGDDSRISQLHSQLKELKNQLELALSSSSNEQSIGKENKYKASKKRQVVLGSACVSASDCSRHIEKSHCRVDTFTCTCLPQHIELNSTTCLPRKYEVKYKSLVMFLCDSIG